MIFKKSMSTDIYDYSHRHKLDRLLLLDHKGPHSQHFILFATYEWAQ
jgi:hypothetical protein